MLFRYSSRFFTSGDGMRHLKLLFSKQVIILTRRN